MTQANMTLGRATACNMQRMCHVSLMWDCMIPLPDDQMTCLLQRQQMNRQVKWKVEDPCSFL